MELERGLKMAHTYKYTILTAIPDQRRGERVNVGIVVFREDRLDVRFQLALQKLKALTGEVWNRRITAIEAQIRKTFEASAPPEDMLRTISTVDPIITPVGLGVVNVVSETNYEKSIQEIMSALVLLPKRRPKIEVQTRINTEIAKQFRRDKVLAKPEESIINKKIVRGLPVVANEGLNADFAVKNGKMHIASTLDLRKQNASLAEAALKSIILDKSVDVFGKNTRKLGVYAVDKDMKNQYLQHIRLLDDYADEIYNWEDAASQKKFLRSIYDSLPQKFFQN